MTTGRDAITIYPAAQLVNMEYDGIATGPDRFVVGNMVEIKHRLDGTAR